jgi:hypothetical protein
VELLDVPLRLLKLTHEIGASLHKGWHYLVGHLDLRMQAAES